MTSIRGSTGREGQWIEGDGSVKMVAYRSVALGLDVVFRLVQEDYRLRQI